ncbi:uncharacterized protein [Amphiura filiformis]|uniref:uncharacterized protein n=1 Tax=Amphiura filiformis TaxID=82378 RepID=UPI003B221E4E
MAYSWGYENFDWSEESGQDIPEEIERLVIKAVEELFHNVPAASDVDRALKVRQAIHVISDTYKTKLSLDIRPNWEDPAFRCAYVYLYFLKHSSLVCDILHTLLHPMAVDNFKPFMRVCCAGGGPGSEIVGIMMYLLNMNSVPYMECSVMDLNPSWKHAWETIQKHIPPEPKVKVNYIPFDMADENSWLWRDFVSALSSADLVTFVKSLSAVQTFIANHRIGTGAIPAVLRALKPGAMVLYIDNMRDDSNMIFLHMTRDEGIHLIEEWHDESYSKPSANFINAMQHFEDMLEYRPLRGCRVSAFLFRKPNLEPERPMLQWSRKNDFVVEPSAHNGGFTWSSPYNNNNNHHRNDYNYNDHVNLDMTYPRNSQPVLHWSPFGGEVCEFRPDPIDRPTFKHLANSAPPNSAIKRRSQRRRTRRPSPLQKRQPGRSSPTKEMGNTPAGPGQRESVGDSVNTQTPAAKIDFTADCH